MSEPQILQPSFLFRFEVGLPRHTGRWTKNGLKLPESARLPPLHRLTGSADFAELRMAWSPRGIGFSLRTHGKKQLPWCHDSRPESSDGLHLCIDSRGSTGIHRASRFCHRFVFAPVGGGPRRDQPFAELLPIDRARELPHPVDPAQLKRFSKLTGDGYQLSGWIPTECLTGYDPEEFSRLNLFYVVSDREFDLQPQVHDLSFPVLSDPSMWTGVRLLP
jgi:hypothetical protein